MSTALVTFQVSVPSAAFVSLLGSWDNFSRPYTLGRDLRSGRTIWRACPSFTNIICDGEGVVSEPRDGCLRMGCSYFYYYLVDDDVEMHDPTRPTTRDCPMLPGQTVNILEVPMLAECRRDSVSSSASATEYTLKPEDRFAPVVYSKASLVPPKHHRTPPSSPKTPVDKLPRQPGSSRTKLSSEDHSNIKLPMSQIREGMRLPSRSTSCPSTGQLFLEEMPARDTESRMTGWQRPTSSPVNAVSTSWSEWMPARILWSAGDAASLGRNREMMIFPELVDKGLDPRDPASQVQCQPEDNAGRDSSTSEQNLYALDDTPKQARHRDTTNLTNSANGNVADCLQLDATPELELNLDLGFDLESGHGTADLMSSIEDTLSHIRQPQQQSQGQMVSPEELEGPLLNTSQKGLDRSFSTRSSAFFTSSNPTPTIFSLPMSPSQTEFSLDFSPSEAFVLESDESTRKMYSQQPVENASALTLHTLQALPDESAVTPRQETFPRSSQSPRNRRRVEEWVDRSKSNLEELCEDMGYLCQLID